MFDKHTHPCCENNEYHDEETLVKVYQGLLRVGIDGQKATDAVFAMQKEGILFRERKDAPIPVIQETLFSGVRDD
jgi:hypothetical protein